jgi:hypothetical protein
MLDHWSKDEVKTLTGVDLNEPPPSVPEVLFHWTAPVKASR